MKIMLTMILGLFLCFSAHSEAAVKKKTIGIFGFKSDQVAPWDPDSTRKGISGSEEAVIYMSQELAKMGYQVTVLANPPAGSTYSEPKANPRFIGYQYDDGRKYDIAISWRMPNYGKVLKKRAKQVYLWPHDLLQSDVTAEDTDAYDDVLWLSESQRQQWASQSYHFYKFSNIYGNGIDLKQFKTIRARKNPYACIYASNYGRGLEILLQNWPAIKKMFPLATLDIYYGWETYGLLASYKKEQMKQQIRDLATLGVTEHGRVGHDELNQAFGKASFWTYPCTHEETFCITALRAQFSGAVPVIIDGSALLETVRHGYRCDDASKYFTTLIRAMQEANKIALSQRIKMGEFIQKNYTWEAVAHKWEHQFNEDASR